MFRCAQRAANLLRPRSLKLSNRSFFKLRLGSILASFSSPIQIDTRDGRKQVGQFVSTSCDSMLSADQVRRYSRQLILEQIGVEGQLRLKNGSVLIVGCGGLGCPSSMYLAAAGVGRIGLLDHDTVEMNNLHRQTLHRETGLGESKAQSIKNNLIQLNSSVHFDVLNERLSGQNALQLVNNYDVIVDASDNAPTRYLLNDACVLAGKPLVSGSALKFDGQLTLYNYKNEGPCYRCLYPRPPPPGTVTNCSDGGVLGVVPGIIGSLQALEVIKILVDIGPSYSGKMLLFDAIEGTFRTIRIRAKRPDCQACGPEPSVDPSTFDYENFCGSRACDKTQQLKVLHELERISVEEYQQIMNRCTPHLLIDVRPANDYKIVSLPNSISIPLGHLQQPKGMAEFERIVNEQRAKLIEQAKQEGDSNQLPTVEVYVMCKRGNASQKAVDYLKKNLLLDNQIELKDIEGGITAWSERVDSSVPIY